MSLAYGEWHKSVIQFFDYETFKSEWLKRQFRLQSNLGIAALNNSDLTEVRERNDFPDIRLFLKLISQLVKPL